MSFWKTIVKVAAGPVGLIADAVAGNASGGVKTALGLLSGNPMLVADGLLSGKKGPSTEVAGLPALGKQIGGAPYGCGGSSGGPRYNAQSPLDSNFGKYINSLKTIQANRSTFDSACGRQDGLISEKELRAVANNPNSSPDLREAAQFMLDNPAYMNRAAQSGRDSFKDILRSPLNHVLGEGVSLSGADLTSAIGQAEFDVARYGMRPPAGHGSSHTHGAGQSRPSSATSQTNGSSSSHGNVSSSGTRSDGCNIRDIVSGKASGTSADQSMAVLKDMYGQLDDEVNSLMQQMKEGKGDKQMLQLELQQKIEERSRMYQLMSTLSSKQNEMTNTAIQNMGKA